MDWSKVVGLGVYVLMTGAISYFYFNTSKIFLGAMVPFLSGVLLAVFTGLRVKFSDTSTDDIRSEIWVSGILIYVPVLWYSLVGMMGRP